MHLLAVKLDHAGIGMVHPRDAFHQCALAGAVLAHQPVDLTVEKGGGHVFQRMHSTEMFIDPNHFKHLVQSPLDDPRFHSGYPDQARCHKSGNSDSSARSTTANAPRWVGDVV